MAKLTEAQINAQKKWESENKDKRAYVRDKSACKRFIRIAKDEDLEEVIKLIQERKK